MHKASIRCKALSLPFILKTKIFSYFRLNNATQSCTILQDNHVKHIFIFLLPEHEHNTNHLPVGEQLQVPDLHGGFHHPLLDAGCGQPRHVSQGTACLEAVLQFLLRDSGKIHRSECLRNERNFVKQTVSLKEYIFYIISCDNFYLICLYKIEPFWTGFFFGWILFRTIFNVFGYTVQ